MLSLFFNISEGNSKFVSHWMLDSLDTNPFKSVI